MPYAETYKRVYDDLIEPGVREAGLHCNRADERARVGSLEEGLWVGTCLQASSSLRSHSQCECFL